MYKFTLEKYHGKSSRYTCPNCHAAHEFTRYIDGHGDYLADTVGKCNRDSKCGYHYKPKDFFRDNPDLNLLLHQPQKTARNQKKGENDKILKTQQNKQVKGISNAPTVVYRQIAKDFQPSTTDAPSQNYSTIAINFELATDNTPSPNNSKIAQNFQLSAQLRKITQKFIDQQHLLDTIGNYEKNNFVQFLLKLFPDDFEAVNQAVQSYCIGTIHDKTVFWQIDNNWRVRTGKVMLYNPETGKRIAETFINRNGRKVEIKVNWMHSKLKKLGKLDEDFELGQCYFGEHLLSKKTGEPIAIVESEKTAVIASICFPEFVWLACGGKQNLRIEYLKRFGQRQIILFPDSDGFENWQKIARKAQMQNLNIKISTLLEKNLTKEQRREGYDLADFLIAEQREINSFNLYADRYNSAVDKVLRDVRLKQEFITILDEQKAILMIDGNCPENEAETIVKNYDNFRRVVLSLI